MFFELSDPNDTLVNSAVDPIITEYDRMVYLALSEFFFDSGMFSYYKAGIFQMNIVNDKVSSANRNFSNNCCIPKKLWTPRTNEPSKANGPKMTTEK